MVICKERHQLSTSCTISLYLSVVNTIIFQQYNQESLAHNSSLTFNAIISVSISLHVLSYFVELDLRSHIKIQDCHACMMHMP